MVKASAFVIYVLPIVLSVSLGTAVMAETLSASDRELNFLQFGGEFSTSHSSQDEISLISYSSEIIQNSNLEFSIQITNIDFDCGDLYITIFDVSTSEKQVLTQSGFLKQCFTQNNNKLPVDDNYSELISKSGKYEILVGVFDERYSKNLSLTEELLVK